MQVVYKSATWKCDGHLGAHPIAIASQDQSPGGRGIQHGGGANHGAGVLAQLRHDVHQVHASTCWQAAAASSVV